MQRGQVQSKIYRSNLSFHTYTHTHFRERYDILLLSGSGKQRKVRRRAYHLAFRLGPSRHTQAALPLLYLLSALFFPCPPFFPLFFFFLPSFFFFFFGPVAPCFQKKKGGTHGVGLIVGCLASPIRLSGNPCKLPCWESSPFRLEKPKVKHGPKGQGA